MTNFSRTLYVGVTTDIVRRVYEHKNQLSDGFTSRYHITQLVYYEATTDILAAIQREKELKGWRRSRKMEMIVAMNPNWTDLSRDWYE